MTMASTQVSADALRRRIPDPMLVQFNELTNVELAWITENGKSAELRAWAGWELEYREAYRVEVLIDPVTGELKRRKA